MSNRKLWIEILEDRILLSLGAHLQAGSSLSIWSQPLLKVDGVSFSVANGDGVHGIEIARHDDGSSYFVSQLISRDPEVLFTWAIAKAADHILLFETENGLGMTDWKSGKFFYNQGTQDFFSYCREHGSQAFQPGGIANGSSSWVFASLAGGSTSIGEAWSSGDAAAIDVVAPLAAPTPVNLDRHVRVQSEGGPFGGFVIEVGGTGVATGGGGEYARFPQGYERGMYAAAFTNDPEGKLTLKSFVQADTWAVPTDLTKIATFVAATHADPSLLLIVAVSDEAGIRNWWDGGFRPGADAAVDSLTQSGLDQLRTSKYRDGYIFISRGSRIYFQGRNDEGNPLVAELDIPPALFSETWKEVVTTEAQSTKNIRSTVEQGLVDSYLDAQMRQSAQEDFPQGQPLFQVLDDTATFVLSPSLKADHEVLEVLVHGAAAGDVARGIGQAALMLPGASFVQDVVAILKSTDPAYDATGALGRVIIDKVATVPTDSSPVDAGLPDFRALVSTFLSAALSVPASAPPDGKSPQAALQIDSSKEAPSSTPGRDDRAFEALSKNPENTYSDHPAGDTLVADGRHYTVMQEFNDTISGGYALALRSESGDVVLAFRGTQPLDGNDLKADVDIRGVGYPQFESMKHQIDGFVADQAAQGKKVSLIGHSLGGALAQWFAAELTANRGIALGQIVTFNSPGIPASTASLFKPELAERVHHYQTANDIVGRAGERFIAGDVTVVTLKIDGLPGIDSWELVREYHRHLDPILVDGGGYANTIFGHTDYISADWLNSPFYNQATTNPAQIPAVLLDYRATTEVLRKEIGVIVSTFANLAANHPREYYQPDGSKLPDKPSSGSGNSSASSTEQLVAASLTEALAKVATDQIVGHWIQSAIDKIKSPILRELGTELIVDPASSVVHDAITEIVRSSGFPQTAATAVAPIFDSARAFVQAIPGYQSATQFFQNPEFLAASVIAKSIIGEPHNTFERAITSITVTGEPISSIVFSIINFVVAESAADHAAKLRRLAESIRRDKLETSVLEVSFQTYFDPDDPGTKSLIASAEYDLSTLDDKNRGDRQYAMGKQGVTLFVNQYMTGRAAFPALVYPGGGPLEDGEQIGLRLVFGMMFAAEDAALVQKTGKHVNELWVARSGQPLTDNNEEAAEHYFATLLNASLFVPPLPTAPPSSLGSLAVSTADGGSVGYVMPAPTSAEPAAPATINLNDDCLEKGADKGLKLTRLGVKLRALADDLKQLHEPTLAGLIAAFGAAKKGADLAGMLGAYRTAYLSAEGGSHAGLVDQFKEALEKFSQSTQEAALGNDLWDSLLTDISDLARNQLTNSLPLTPGEHTFVRQFTRLADFLRDAYDTAKLIQELREDLENCPDLGGVLPILPVLPDASQLNGLLVKVVGLSDDSLDQDEMKLLQALAKANSGDTSSSSFSMPESASALIDALDEVAGLLPASASKTIEIGRAIGEADSILRGTQTAAGLARLSEIAALLNDQIGPYYGFAKMVDADSLALSDTSSELLTLHPGENLIRAPGVTHTIVGANPADVVFALDNDPSTSFVTSWEGSDGGHGGTVDWTIHLSGPSYVSGIDLSLSADARAHGHYIRNWEVSFRVQYQTSEGDAWIDVPGMSDSRSGGDGDGSISLSSPQLNLNLSNILRVRVQVHAFGNAAGGEGVAGGHALISGCAIYGFSEKSATGVSLPATPNSTTSVPTGTSSDLQTVSTPTQANTTTFPDKPNRKYVAAIYSDVLGRAPDPAGLGAWSDQLDQGASRAGITSAIAHSAESFSILIQADYVKFLNRHPDPAGLAFWVGQMISGLTDEQLEAKFLKSAEYVQRAGGTSKAWIDAVYRDLLGRPPDLQGEQYWVERSARGMSRDAVARAFAGSAEREAQRVQSDYQKYLGRAAASAEVAFWLSQFAHGASNEDIVTGFVSSKEYYEMHTGN